MILAKIHFQFKTNNRSKVITDVTQNQQFDVIASASAGSGWDEAILKFGDCFALPHKSPQVLAKTFTILRKVRS